MPPRGNGDSQHLRLSQNLRTQKISVVQSLELCEVNSQRIGALWSAGLATGSPKYNIY